MDRIFYNGVIRTLDAAYPLCSAAAVKDGVILRLGSDEEILALAEAGTEKIDLGKKLMLPGFIDSHLHMLSYIEFLEQVNLSGAASLDEVKTRLSEGLPQAIEKGRWLAGVSFNQDYWDAPLMPTRKDLDEGVTRGSHRNPPGLFQLCPLSTQRHGHAGHPGRAESDVGHAARLL